MKPLTATLLVFACASPVHAADVSAARAKAFSALPNWSGIWLSAAWPTGASGRVAGGEATLRERLQLIRHPPYNASAEAAYETGMKDTAALAQEMQTLRVCTRSFPALMEAPWTFQIAVLPEETLLIFENDQVRHVYTDGRHHPGADELWPTRLGDSIGHWEGDTLVIDTIARQPGPLAPRALFSVLSEQAHFTERLHRVNADQLDDELTIEDPATLARPWHITLTFTRVAELNHLIPYDCLENERNPIVDGQLKITAPPP